MPTSLMAERFRIDKYGVGERCEHPVEGRYTLCAADVADDAYAQELLSRGFAFLDRVLYMEIDLRRERREVRAMPDVQMVVDRDFSEAMVELACRAYTVDRRFHLEQRFDARAAAPVIRAYIEDCRARGMKIYKAVHGEELLGFTVVDESLGGARRFENVLGATTPGIKGKMVAPMLYGAMLAGERERFQGYVGRVSASNAASLNLHYMLGARTTAIYDEYILRPKRP